MKTFVKAVMPFRLSFIVPYMRRGECLMRGPNIFLNKYVRSKPLNDPQASNPAAKEQKEEHKAMRRSGVRRSLAKIANKRLFLQANVKALGHKRK